MTRRAHSSIDKLPAGLRDILTRMIVDNEWPENFSGNRRGKPRYEDMVEYCVFQGYSVSKSAIGRFGMQMRTISRMKSAGLIARETMAGLTDEDAPKTQKAAAEMATALALEFMASSDDFTSRQLKEVCQAIRDCAGVSIKADQYIREQVTEKAKAADKAISAIAAKKKIDPETLKAIREQVYGIVEK